MKKIKIITKIVAVLMSFACIGLAIYALISVLRYNPLLALSTVSIILVIFGVNLLQDAARKD